MFLSCIFHGIYVGIDSADHFDGGCVSGALAGVSSQSEISGGDGAFGLCFLLFAGTRFAEAATCSFAALARNGGERDSCRALSGEVSVL